MARFTYDELRSAFENATDEEKKTILQKYPIAEFDRASIMQTIDESAPEEREIMLKDYPEFRRPDPVTIDQYKPEAGMGELISNVPKGSAAYIGDVAGGFTQAAEDVFTGTNYGQQISQESKKYAKGLQEQMNLLPGSAKSTIYGAGVSALPNAGLIGLSAVNPAFAPYALNIMGGIAAGSAYSQAKEEGYTPGQSALIALGKGAVEKYSEKIPLDDLIKIPAIKNTIAQNGVALARYFGLEIAQEETALLGESIIDYISNNPNATLENFKKDFVETAKQTAVAAPFLGGVGMGLGTFRKQSNTSGTQTPSQPELLPEEAKQQTISGLKDFLKQDVVRQDEQDNETLIEPEEKIEMAKKQFNIPDEIITQTLVEMNNETEELAENVAETPVQPKPIPEVLQTTKELWQMTNEEVETLLPPIKNGYVRFYHGGIPGEGSRDLTPNFEYAKGYANKSGQYGKIQYVDISENDPLLKPVMDVSGTNMKPIYAHFTAPENIMKNAKIIDLQSAAKTPITIQKKEEINIPKEGITLQPSARTPFQTAQRENIPVPQPGMQLKSQINQSLQTPISTEKAIEPLPQAEIAKPELQPIASREQKIEAIKQLEKQTSVHFQIFPQDSEGNLDISLDSIGREFYKNINKNNRLIEHKKISATNPNSNTLISKKVQYLANKKGKYIGAIIPVSAKTGIPKNEVYYIELPHQRGELEYFMNEQFLESVKDNADPNANGTPRYYIGIPQKIEQIQQQSPQAVNKQVEPLPTPKLATPEQSSAVQKEPWQMTKKEYVTQKIEAAKIKYPNMNLNSLDNQRKKFESDYDNVIQTISQNVNVPIEVLDSLSQSQRNQIFKFNEELGKRYFDTKQDISQMTYKQYLKELGTKNYRWQKNKEDHRSAIKQALSEGKTIPPKVLAEYPDLQPVATKTDMFKDMTPREQEQKAAENTQDMFAANPLLINTETQEINAPYSRIGKPRPSDLNFEKRFKEKGLDPNLIKIRGSFLNYPRNILYPLADGYDLKFERIDELKQKLKDDRYMPAIGIVQFTTVGNILTGPDAQKQFDSIKDTQIWLTKKEEKIDGYPATAWVDSKTNTIILSTPQLKFLGLRALKGVIVHEAEHVLQLKKGQKYDSSISYKDREMEKGAFETEKKYRTGVLAFALPTPQSEKASKPIPTPEGQPQPDLSKVNVGLLEISDMLEFLQQYAKIIPNVMSKMRGTALGRFYNIGPGGKITLDYKLAQNPDLAKKVLAHEIGHLVDWLEGKDVPKTLTRGNILGHVAALFKYLKTTISLDPKVEDFITSKERGKLRQKAAEIVDNSALGSQDIENRNQYIREVFKDLLAEKISDRGLIEKIMVQEELLNASLNWYGISEAQFESTDEAYQKYFKSGKELYANAFSIFMNNPALFKKWAPNVHSMFIDYMRNRPNAMIAYNKMLQEIADRRSGKIDEGKKIYENTAKMFFKSDEKVLDSLNQDKETKLLSWLGTALIDKNWEILLKDPKNHKLINALEKMSYINSISDAYMRSIGFDEFEKQGVTEADMNQYMYYMRIIKERSIKPVFDKINAVQAQKALDTMGAEKIAKIKSIHDKFWAARKKFVVNVLKEANLYNDDLMTKIKDNEFYATWDVVKYLDENFGPGNGISASIKKQYGTFQDIASPFTATIMKDLVLMKAANKAIAAKAVIEMLDKKGEAQKAKYNFTFKRFEAPPEGKGIIEFLDNNKYVGYYVDEGIAKSFEDDPLTNLASKKAFDMMVTQPSNYLRGLFITYNPGFQLFNIMRDALGNFSKLPKTLNPRNFARLLGLQLKEIKNALRNAQNQELITDMLGKGELISGKEFGLVAGEYQTPLEFIKASYGMDGKKVPVKDVNTFWKVMSVFAPLQNFIKNQGMRLEMASKIAGRQYLDMLEQTQQVKFSDGEKSHMIRAWAGSPAFLRKGEFYPFYNNIFLFANAQKEGIRADLESFKYSPREYIEKKILFSIAPKVLMLMFAASNEEWWDKVSEYDKTNYTIIPLPYEDAEGNVAYLRAPQDEFSRLVGGLFWKAMKPLMKQELNTKEIFDLTAVAAGQLPTTNPLIGVINDIAQISAGKNPYDYFRGRTAIDEQVFKAQDIRTLEDFLKYELNSLGLQVIYKLPQTEDLNLNTMQKIVDYPFLVSNVVGRFVKINKRGLEEKARDVKKDYERENAQRLLDIKEAAKYDYEDLTPEQQKFLSGKNYQQYQRRRKELEIPSVLRNAPKSIRSELERILEEN